MDLMNTLLGRRSVRQFTDEPVSAEELRQIVQAGMLAPSGKGIRPWQLIVITDPETLHSLTDCRKGSAKMLQTATAAIVVLGDTTKSDTCIEDSSLVMGYMHLMASSLGLGSCWLQVRLRPSNVEGESSEDFLRNKLGFPANMQAEAMLVLGHPATAPAPHTPDELPMDRVHSERW